MRLFRSSLLAALLALASIPFVQAAQTGVLTCGNLSVKASYFDLSAAPASGGNGILTVHLALHQFSTLMPAVGLQVGPCTLTHNAITYTLNSATLSGLDAIAAAASTGSAGSSTYTQAVFQIGGISVNGGTDGDNGGDDGGWNRVHNTPDPSGPAIQ